MNSIVEATGFVTTHTTQDCFTVKFCRKKNKKNIANSFPASGLLITSENSPDQNKPVPDLDPLFDKLSDNAQLEQEMSQSRDKCPQRNWSSIRQI